MLNEDKLRLMTGIALFEKREGKRISPATRYFRNDYISSHLLRAFFSYTFCYLLCGLVWLLYNSEQLLNATNLDEVTGVAVRGGILYVAGLIFYLILTRVVYGRRYDYAARGMKVYLAKLRRLEKRYEFQSRAKELTKEGNRL